MTRTRGRDQHPEPTIRGLDQRPEPTTKGRDQHPETTTKRRGGVTSARCFSQVVESKAASIQAVFARLFFPKVVKSKAASIQAVFARLFFPKVLLGASWGPPGAPLGAFWGPLGGDSQAALDLCFRCYPRGCRGFLALFGGGFWHRFLVLSCRVAFRLQMLSSGLSWLFGCCFETQAFDLKLAVVIQTVT